MAPLLATSATPSFKRVDTVAFLIAGDIIRLQPNLVRRWKFLEVFCFDSLDGQLHFANPQAYTEIYNLKNKWDKDPVVYGAFDLDQSSACYTKYADAKPRREVLSPLFSRSSILRMQGLIQERVSLLSISPAPRVHVDLSGGRAL